MLKQPGDGVDAALHVDEIALLAAVGIVGAL
jgi:hypothetical protein